MPEWASTTVIVVLVVVIFLGMWAAWRGRARRDAGLVPVRELPARLSAPIVAARVLYVATTRPGEPLQRLAIPGLGFRAQGVVSVHASGVAIELDGDTDVWIQASALIAADPAQVAIDKVVERGGLFKLTWRVSDQSVDSYFRVLEPEKSGAIYDAIDAITSTSAESEV